MKRTFILAALAVMAFVGCNKEAAVDSIQTVDGPAAMLKVNLKAAGTITKAAGDSFAYGTADENVVNKVDFYFYDASGNPYSVVSNGDNVINWKKGTEVNVEKISNAVLVIRKSQEALPTHVVAVLNSKTDYKTKTLAEMGAALATLTTDQGFVMSNSVYVDGNGAKVVATEISPENVFTVAAPDTLPDAGAELDLPGVDPVDIYVERVAAKVVVNPRGLMPVYDPADAKKQMKDADGQLVYAKVLGWDITNCTSEGYLVKSIDPEWTATAVGFSPWNNAALYRSYWAATTATPAHPHTYTALTKHNVKFDYYYENTKGGADKENSIVSGEGNQTPQLLVAAMLTNEKGEAINLAKWYNVLYTIKDLKIAMANKLAAKLYVKVSAEGEDAKYVSVNVDDIDFQQRKSTVADNRYEVLALPKAGVTYYTVNGDEVSVVSEAEAISTFKDLAPAMMWKEGATYYYSNIQHFGDATGMVRNHVYDITLTGVKGFGTPVYNPDEVIIPERTDEQEYANLAAQINILSWHVVANEVTLQ